MWECSHVWNTSREVFKKKSETPEYRCLFTCRRHGTPAERCNNIYPQEVYDTREGCENLQIPLQCGQGQGRWGAHSDKGGLTVWPTGKFNCLSIGPCLSNVDLNVEKYVRKYMCLKLKFCMCESCFSGRKNAYHTNLGKHTGPVKCPVASVLEFLQSQFSDGLSTSTLKVCVAALAAFHKHLRKHKLIVHFICGAWRMRPGFLPGTW